LQRGVISILRLHRCAAEPRLWKTALTHRVKATVGYTTRPDFPIIALIMGIVENF
jgi:hypothetical protein